MNFSWGFISGNISFGRAQLDTMLNAGQATLHATADQLFGTFRCKNRDLKTCLWKWTCLKEGVHQSVRHTFTNHEVCVNKKVVVTPWEPTTELGHPVPGTCIIWSMIWCILKSAAWGPMAPTLPFHTWKWNWKNKTRKKIEETTQQFHNCRRGLYVDYISVARLCVVRLSAWRRYRIHPD